MKAVYSIFDKADRLMDQRGLCDPLNSMKRL